MYRIQGSHGKMPLYEEAVKLENSLRVMDALARRGGIASFSTIESESKVEGSKLVHHLNRLQKLGVIQKEVRGTYRLTYKTPLCYIFDAKPKLPTAYLGLLGKKDEEIEPEPKVALELLVKEGITPKLIYTVTSPEALNDWKNRKLPYQWILCYEDEIIDIEAVKRKVIPQLENLLKENIVVMDCTSATKPSTIAYYELAQSYCIPLIYVHEETRRLKWLISRESIKQKFGIK